MRRLPPVVLGVLGLLLLAAPVGACTPCRDLSDAEKLQRADLVLVGVVSDRDSVFAELATVQVEEVVKGRVAGSIAVRDGVGNPCLSPLREGRRYHLFLVRSGDDWARLACAAAVQLTAEPVLPWWRIYDEWVATAVAVTVATCLVLVFLRLRRARR
ncbi:hypothetical protein [Catellatospora sp. NPDC049609]|uniref:hypothetical protein n=1 Tax=Catellatospora sp. NPDC049609 TaxID=3155505 RepID=UPI00341E8747